ncbi:MAG: hypothetical protein P8181_11770 [bacterium]
MRKIKVKCSYMTAFGRLEPDIVAIALEAARAVLDTADPEELGHVYLASYAPAELCGIPDPFGSISGAIRRAFPGISAEFHGMFRTGGHALFTALEAMDTNPQRMLVLGVEKMTHRPPAETAGILSQRENPHDRGYGATLPALGALVTRAYMRRHDVPETALHGVAVKNHKNAAWNPKAQFRRPVTMDEVASSPLVSDPLRRFHCAPTTDGAAALLLDADDGEVWYRGWGRGSDLPLFQDRSDIPFYRHRRRGSGGSAVRRCGTQRYRHRRNS